MRQGDGIVDSPKCWSQLSTTQKQLIDRYLDHRTSELPIVVEGSVKSSRGLIQRRREAVRNELGIILRQVICGRQDKDYRVTTARDVSSETFDIEDFSPNDVYLIKKWYLPNQFYLKCCTLKPFLFYVLMRKEQKTFADPNLDAEFNQFRKRVNASVAAMPVKAPPENKRQQRGRKVFLTRKLILDVYQELMWSPGYESFFAQIEFLTAFMVFMFLGTRCFELSHLRIENFELDAKGYIKAGTDGFRFDAEGHVKTGEKGYGVMWLTISKGDYSRSHKKYGTLIVPNLVTLINKYLGELYKMYPESRGKGYLFRSRKKRYDPESRAAPRTISNWFESRRKQLDTLPKDQRLYLSSHDGRHSMNSLITKAHVPGQFVDARDRAAEIQMRHNIERKSGSVSDVNYTDEIPFQSYYEIIDRSLNFPWDLEQLCLWEQQMGYVDPPEDTEDPLSAVALPAEEAEQRVQPAQLSLNVKEMESELKKLLRGCPGGMNVRKWTKRINELKAAIAAAKEAS